MNNIIEVKNLTKSFKDIKAVDGISFNVKEGSMFAFIGLNGAGKSTTINMICGNLPIDSGEIFINDINICNHVDDVKHMLGVVYQDSVLDKQLTVKENLQFKAAMYNIGKSEFQDCINRIDSLLDIKNFINRPVGKLSGGQRRKIDIARAIIHNPKILILDEPTTGLDPQTRKTVWNAIHTLKKQQNLTVFLTTHYMEEIVDADNVVIMDSGKIVAQGTPLELKNKYTGDFIRLYNISEKDVQSLKMKYKKLPECYVIEIKNSQDATKLISKHAKVFKDYEIIKGKMDDVFLAATGKTFE